MLRIYNNGDSNVKYSLILIIGVLLLATVFVAGCVGSSYTTTTSILPAENTTPAPKQIIEPEMTPIDETAVVASRPDELLPPRGAFTYLDAKKSNEISLCYQYSTFRQSITYESWSGSNRMTAPDGEQYLLVSIRATHKGNRDGKYYITQTPYPSAFTLYGTDGSYTPVIPADKSSDHTSVGELYASKFLDRKENQEGFLIYQVPKGFSLSDGYLGVNLGEVDSHIYWNLAE